MIATQYEVQIIVVDFYIYIYFIMIATHFEVHIMGVSARCTAYGYVSVILIKNQLLCT